jgi:holo-[acyl-carrier protein] synthase
MGEAGRDGGKKRESRDVRRSSKIRGMIRVEAIAMVLGLGTDIIEIVRVQASIDRYGEQFLQRVFTEGEIAYCLRKKRNAAESFAARFAAKEAGAKALGTGISQGVSWREIEVRRAPGQRPELELSGRARERARTMGVHHISLSLTHSRDVAMAVVILED